MKSSPITHPADHQIPNNTFTQLMSDVLSAGKLFRFRAGGWSMYPFIQNGDILTIEPLIGDIQIGDIVSIHNEKIKLVIHRVVLKTNDGFIIKGDNITDVDGVFVLSDIFGRVTKIERGKQIFTFGLGNERKLISFLSRYQILIPLVKLGILFSRFIKLWKLK